MERHKRAKKINAWLKECIESERVPSMMNEIKIKRIDYGNDKCRCEECKKEEREILDLYRRREK